jgi:hypothetical protein
MDVVLVDRRCFDQQQKNSTETWMDTGVILIEFNVFGAECPGGASLFNWDLDYNILYGKMKEYDDEGNTSNMPAIRFTPPDQVDKLTELMDQDFFLDNNF